MPMYAFFYSASITKNMAKKYQVREIQAWRSVKRHHKTNESMFYTVWKGGEVTLEPMSNFYDLDEHNEYMHSIVCDFANTAAKFPFANRTCLTCNKKVHGGNIFCNSKKGIGKCSDLRKRYN